jgi:predicted nucleic acid-binding protein
VIVLDCSALVHVLAVDGPDERLLEALSAEPLHAPHLLDVEVLHALRGLELGGKIAPSRANLARETYRQLTIERHAMAVVEPRVWALRHSLTAYDATYVALAEVLECPLVTTDRKLAAGGGHRAEVHCYGGG